jgi:hypothetical protein
MHGGRKHRTGISKVKSSRRPRLTRGCNAEEEDNTNLNTYGESTILQVKTPVANLHLCNLIHLYLKFNSSGDNDKF